MRNNRKTGKAISKNRHIMPQIAMADTHGSKRLSGVLRPPRPYEGYKDR